MQFRVGETYKTRDSKDVLIVYDFGDDALFPLLGVIEGADEPERWTREGRWLGEQDSTHDLMANALTAKFWMNFNNDNGLLVFDGLYNTIEDAELHASEFRASRFPVEVREGEFRK